MVEANTNDSESYSNPNTDQFRFREAFVQIGNIFKSQPNALFWAGERYYRRQHIEIDDFYPLDMSGYGAGVENFNVGFGKTALAFLGGARPDIVTNAGTYSKGNIDARVYDIKAPLGQIAFWFDYAGAKGGSYQQSVCTAQQGTCTAAQSASNVQQRVTIPTTTGYAFGFTHQRLKWENGYTQFGIQYGKGAASDFSSSLDNPTIYMKNSQRFLVTEQVVIQPNQKFAIMPIALYERVKDGNPVHGTDRWLSFGARPQYFFTEHVSLAFEGGFDRVWSGQHLYNGWLRKFTIAPQIGAGREFFSRPVLRAFLTYGNWSEGLMGFVGGIPYQARTNGLTYGVQAETWW
jgi:maltoporin